MSVPSSVTLPKLRLSPKKVISPQIYDFLRKHITETTIKPGTLLSENSLSEHFNVSRQPVREALMRLSYEGLLSVLPQRGSIVERISVSELEQTVFVRAAIEKECIMMFPSLDGRARRNCLNQLQKILDHQKEIHDDPEQNAVYLRLDDSFHERLCAISGAPMAWNTIQSIKGQMDRIRFLTCSHISPPSEVTAEHEEIFNALKEERMQDCLEILNSHLTHINETHKAIIRDYSDWFTPESLSHLNMHHSKEQ